MLKEYPKRTNQQSKSVHLWFHQIKDELNDAGFEQQITIGTVDVPWSEKTVKSMFKSIGRSQFEQSKTSKMTTKELSAVAETFIRFFGKKGLALPPFPSEETLAMEKQYGKLTPK